MQDFKYLSISKTALDRLARKPEDIIGKFAGADKIVAKDTLEKFIGAIRVLKEEFQKTEVEVTVGPPILKERKTFTTVFQLIDNSKGKCTSTRSN